MPEDRNLIEVKIGALIMDPNTNSPIVVLKGVESEAVLPIWVGAFEANAIALEIEKVLPQRPMTHDLLRNLIIQCGLEAQRVIVTDLAENTFYARVELIDVHSNEVSLDARPSDAIALALRLDCPIFVDQDVLDKSAAENQPGPTPTDDEPPVEEWPELIG
ncbi:MAG: bifunctional nuclease family protein [Acidobacteriota bacterium]|nr:MAG: bifunctional nuclease family protein [Acidobacteriota bacterium]